MDYGIITGSLSANYSCARYIVYLTPPFCYRVSSDEEDSPRRSSMKNTPSPRKERHISFAEEEDGQTRVLTPEILKVNVGKVCCIIYKSSSLIKFTAPTLLITYYIGYIYIYQ